MSLLHKSGGECLLSSLELFTVPPTQALIDKVQFVKYYPLTSLETGPIEFKVNSSEFEYLDLNNIYLYTKNRILDGRGQPIPPTVPARDAGGEIFNQRGIVFPVNNFHSSRFKSLELYINNVAITEVDSLYAYRCYLETLLSYGRGAKETTLRPLLWAKDRNPDGNFTKMEEESESDLTEDCNIGGWQRFQVSKFSTCFETMGKIHADILLQERLLPSNCELRLRFHRADPAFALIAKHDSEKFTIAIDTAMLMVRHVEVSPAICEVHAKAALSSTYKFPVRKVKSLFFTHSSGRQDLSMHNVLTGRLPRRFVLGMVKSSAFHGDLSSSPFNFQPFDVVNVVARLNLQSYPSDSGIETDLKNGIYFQGYWSMLQATSSLFTNADIDLNPWSDYANGSCLFRFDFSPEMQSGNCEHLDLLREGNLDLQVKLDSQVRARSP